LVPLPIEPVVSDQSPNRRGYKVKHTTSGADLDVEGSDAELLAAGRNVLGSQHGGVGRRLVTIGLDLHATGNTADGFATAGITQMSASEPRVKNCMRGAELRIAPLFLYHVWCSVAYEPEIGDVDEGVVL
jgi:hypothetical protein